MKITKLTTEEKIVNHLSDNGQKNSWLAKKLGCTPVHLHFVLKGNAKTKRELTPKNLEIINQILKTNF